MPLLPEFRGQGTRRSRSCRPVRVHRWSVVLLGLLGIVAGSTWSIYGGLSWLNGPLRAYLAGRILRACAMDRRPVDRRTPT